MRPHIWLNGASDPCLTDPNSPGFNDPHWSTPNAELVIDQQYSLEYGSEDLLDRLLSLPIEVCEQQFGLKDVEIYEYAEVAGVCRHGQHWYRLCMRSDHHPHGTWCHVLVGADETITGLRLEPS